MPTAIRPLIAGNWKMNGLKASIAEFEAMLAGSAGLAAKCDLLVIVVETDRETHGAGELV